jgi:Rad3-related DNA helicase
VSDISVEADKQGILSHFPLEKARRSQVALLKEIDKAYEEGKKIIIVEAPVGSGKSAIAITLARHFKDCHVITPRKALQNQYFDDFPDDVVLMKGRNAYPCTLHAGRTEYNRVIKEIQTGRVRAPTREEDNCASAPCRNSKKIFESCVGLNGPCPFTTAIELAQKNRTVVHNLHSFIYQTNFGDKFEKRSMMIIDEAHEIEDALREFVTKEFTLAHALEADAIPTCETIDEWCNFFESPEFLPAETERGGTWPIRTRIRPTFPTRTNTSSRSIPFGRRLSFSARASP